MSRGSLLYPESPLTFSRTLAARIGLNEAILLQQVQYWIDTFQQQRKKETQAHLRDGHWWVWNNYSEWQEDNFPFMSLTTIKRTVINLERQGLLVTMQPGGNDRTKWYRINYDHSAFRPKDHSGPIESEIPSDQIGLMDGTTLASCKGPNRALPPIEPEITSEITHNTAQAHTLPFDEFWPKYPTRDGKRIGRSEAEAVWGRMADPARSAAMTGVRHYADACDPVTGVTKAMDAHRWLTKRRWEEWQTPAVPSQRRASDPLLRPSLATVPSDEEYAEAIARAEASENGWGI